MSVAFGFSDRVEVTPDETAVFLEFAKRTARSAGSAVLPYFRSPLAVENKHVDGTFDPVTEADKAAEFEIRAAIEHSFPAHGIYGEEFGYKHGNGLTWVIDPIDGTRAFMSGMLHWGVLLALFDGEVPVLGVMYQPYTDELFFGDGQQAALIRSGVQTPLRTAAGVVEVAEAVLATTGPDWFVGDDLTRFERLRPSARMCRYGGDCYLFAAAALGFVHLATDASLNAYDIQALIPIIRGAGGVVTTYDGGNPAMGGTVLASSNSTLHERALAILNE